MRNELFNKTFFFNGLILVLIFQCQIAYTQGIKDTLSRSCIGFKFASDFNSFFRSQSNPLIDGYFSCINLGPFYKYYFKNGTIETGINFLYKEKKSGFNFPVVMENFTDGENTAITAIDASFIVGPRFWYFYPKFGFTMGYFLKQEGFFSDENEALDLNPFYFSIPVGFTLDLPTSFGSTGIGFYYKVGLSNVISLDIPEPSKLRSFNFEIHVSIKASE